MRQHIIEVFIFDELNESSKQRALEEAIKLALRNYEYFYIEGGSANMGWGGWLDLLPEMDIAFGNFHEYMQTRPRFGFLRMSLGRINDDPEDRYVFEKIIYEIAYNCIIDFCKKHEYTNSGKIFSWVSEKRNA